MLTNRMTIYLRRASTLVMFALFSLPGHVKADECGNGRLNSGEDCDWTGERPYPEKIIWKDNLPDCEQGLRAACWKCKQYCYSYPTCGDGILEEGEWCDDGIMNSDLQPDACRSNCRWPYCGDSVIDTGEDCDDGSSNADFTPDHCRADCTLPYCGDGVVDTGHGEECDEGANNSDEQGATCSKHCIIPGCGNNVLEKWEQCDDGNTSDLDDCTGQCRYNVCGDGFLRTGSESCEYETRFDPGDCRYDCGQDPAKCGNGVLDPGEECDDGIDRNSDDPDVRCRTNCLKQRCGDGIVDKDEQCDGQPGCGPDCNWIARR